MFWEPKDAVAFTVSPKLIETMDHVRQFSHSKGLMGGDMEAVGIAFPGGKTLGSGDNVKLSYSDDYL
jgi:NitT/TauT family transport system substrate-binding protein